MVATTARGGVRGVGGGGGSGGGGGGGDDGDGTLFPLVDSAYCGAPPQVPLLYHRLNP